jgi:molybdate transport system substrate-binding protein
VVVDVAGATRGGVMELRVLSAGAAKGLVEALAPALLAATGATLRGEFGAVGAIRDRLVSGAPCDVIILTAAMLDALVQDGRAVADTVLPLGRVRTGIAVRKGEALPPVADRDELRRSLLAANGLYLPDPERSTAGVHFMKVLHELGIDTAVASRLRAFPNGAIAMSELAQSREGGLIGCTQITEIRYTAGLVLVGPLPAEFELATTYSVAVTTSAQRPNVALGLARMLAGDASRELRRDGGFDA